jgi:hypothetical protein
MNLTHMVHLIPHPGQLVACPRLLIKYISKHSTYVNAILSIHTVMMRHAVVAGAHLTRRHFIDFPSVSPINGTCKIKFIGTHISKLCGFHIDVSFFYEYMKFTG